MHAKSFTASPERSTMMLLNHPPFTFMVNHSHSRSLFSGQVFCLIHLHQTMEMAELTQTKWRFTKSSSHPCCLLHSALHEFLSSFRPLDCMNSSFCSIPSSYTRPLWCVIHRLSSRDILGLRLMQINKLRPWIMFQREGLHTCLQSPDHSNSAHNLTSCTLVL